MACLGCEQHPLKSLREMYGLETLKQFQQERSVKFFMFNHAIAHDDLEALKILFTQAKRVIYEDLRLSQARREGAEPVYFYPLHLAAQFGAMNIAKFCLENNADVNSLTQSNLPEFDKNTPAHIAVMFGKHEALTTLLSCGGINLNSKNGVGKTIEDLAREKSDQFALTIINKAKARLN